MTTEQKPYIIGPGKTQLAVQDCWFVSGQDICPVSMEFAREPIINFGTVNVERVNLLKPGKET